MDILSYLLGKNSAGGGGGGSEYPNFTSVKVLNDFIDAALVEFQSQMMDILDTYKGGTNDPITLHSPGADYKYYLIQKRSSGKYRAVWFTQPGVQMALDALYVLGWGYAALGSTDYDITNLVIHAAPGSASPQAWYYTREYSTVADCIQALQSSSTTYTASSNSLGYVSDTTDDPIPYSNAILVDARSGDTYPFYKPLKISSNETIEYN